MIEVIQQQHATPIYKRDYEHMVSVRDYLPEDVQELASIYFNTGAFKLLLCIASF